MYWCDEAMRHQHANKEHDVDVCRVNNFHDLEHMACVKVEACHWKHDV